MRLACVRLILALSLFALSIPAQTTENSAATEQILQGDDSLAGHRYADAIRAYKQADDLEHHACLQCTAGLSRAYSGMHNWKEALATADKYLTQANDDSSKAMGHILKGSALMGMIHSDGGDLRTAEAELRTALSIPGTDPLAHFYLGQVLLLESRDAGGALELHKYLELTPDGPMASLAKQWMERPGRVRGTFSPDFHFTADKGEEISLGALKGKTVVLDFWATWCPPCRAALPDLKDLVKKYGGGDFALISISVDQDGKAWRDYVDKKQMGWPQYLDKTREINRNFEIDAIPTYVVIASDGSILTRVQGTESTKSIAYRLKDILAKVPALNVTKN